MESGGEKESGGSKGSVNLGDICPMGVRRSRYDQ